MLGVYILTLIKCKAKYLGPITLQKMFVQVQLRLFPRIEFLLADIWT